MTIKPVTVKGLSFIRLNSLIFHKKMATSIRLNSDVTSYVKRCRTVQQLKSVNTDFQAIIKNGDILLCDSKYRILLGKPIIQKGSHPVLGSLIWTSLKDISDICPALEERVVLLDVTPTGRHRLACHLPEIPQEQLTKLEKKCKGKFIGLILAAMGVTMEEATIVSQAGSLLQWNRHHQFCAACGCTTIRNAAGSQRTCSSCKKVHHPVTSPVAIVLLQNKTGNQLLLVRQPHHPKGMYTCVAGFIEVGETVETCIKREVAEEVGLFVEKSFYVSSQHWPLPISNLMLAFNATVEPGELVIDHSELEDARWFSIDQVQEAYNNVKENPFIFLSERRPNDLVLVPPTGAIAHHLIKDWLKSKAGSSHL